MKVIISHDVDHIEAREHWTDAIIPKFVVRTLIESATSSVTMQEMGFRFQETFITGKWQNIHELMRFDRTHNVKSTFFVGVNKGLGLSYTREQASFWIKKIIENGFDVGLHANKYAEKAGIQSEYDLFKKLSNLHQFGVRTHYLQMAESTLHDFNSVGFTYDTSLYGIQGSFRVGEMYEFPLHIMDTRVFYSHSRLYPIKFNQAQEFTKQVIEQVMKQNVPFLTILFHDRYYSRAFLSWKDWYEWVVEYLIENDIQFVNYRDAISEINCCE